jgi:solute carrier family 25 oxoglutarate transporter 11
MYDVLKEKVVPQGETPSFAIKGAIALFSGGVSSFFCCPIEVALVRMQGDSRLPVEQQRGYTSAFNALYRIGAEEGVRTYFRGAVPTMVRASVVAMTQLATYDQAKEVWQSVLNLSEGTKLHLLSGVTSGFIYSAVSLPLDTAKTRSQSQKPLADGTLKYKGLLHTLKTIGAQEGPLSLWRGFPAYFLRGGGHTVMMFVILEQYRAKVKEYYAAKTEY